METVTKRAKIAEEEEVNTSEKVVEQQEKSHKKADDKAEGKFL